ncbi:MAG: hypothetical protein ACLPKB_25875 [Xanthobacteraceae bacterium]
MRRISSPDLKVLIAAALTSAAVAVGSSDIVLRALCGMSLVSFLPGYAAMRLLRPQAAFSLSYAIVVVGVSFGLCIAGGLALQLVGAMNSAGWAILLSTVTVALAVAADRVSMPELPASQIAETPPQTVVATAGVTSKQTALLAASLLTVGCAFWVARDAAIARQEFWATEFWMVPRGESPIALTLGVRNREQAPADYAVELTLEGDVIAAWRSIRLRPGESWTTPIDLPVETHAGRRAEAQLFKNNDRQTVYRRVWADAGRRN